MGSSTTLMKRHVTTAGAVGLMALAVLLMCQADPQHPNSGSSDTTKVTKKDLAPVIQQIGLVSSQMQKLDKKVDEVLKLQKVDKKVDSIPKPIESKRSLLVFPDLALSFTLLVALAAALLSAFSFKKSLELARALSKFERRTSHELEKLDPIETIHILVNRLQPLVPRTETADGKEKGGKGERSGDRNSGANRQPQPKQNLPYGYGKRKDERSRSEAQIDESVLMNIGAECLSFPLSVEQFRQRWEELGGDRQVRVQGFPEQGDDPTVFLIYGGDGRAFVVPNTTDWDRLARTDLFDAEGQVGPGSRVKELLQVAQAVNSRGGGLQTEEYGRVRVDL